MAKIRRRQFIQGAAALGAAAATGLPTPAAADEHGPPQSEPTVNSRSRRTHRPAPRSSPSHGISTFCSMWAGVSGGLRPAGSARAQVRMPGAGGARVEQHAVLAVGHPWVVRAGHLATDDAVVGVEEFGVAVDWTEDVILMPGIGSRYKAVVFGSTSRDTMWKHGTAVNPTAAVNTTTGAHLDAAKTALRQYVRAGGGFVAIHNAVGGTECNWPYYEGLCGVTHNSNVRGATQFFEGLFDVRLSPGESFRYIFGRRGEYFFNDPFAARTTGKVEVY